MISDSFFDFSPEKSLNIIDHKDEIRILEFSLNNQWLASGSWDKHIIIWKIIDNEGLKRIEKHKILNEHSSSITSLKFCEDNHYLISGSKDGMVKIWDINEEKSVFTLQHNNSKVFSIDIDPLKDYIVSAGEDRTIIIWKIIKDRNNNWIRIEKANFVKSDKGPKEKIHVVKINSRIPIFSSIGDENTIYLWDFPSGKLNYKLEGHRKMIYTMDFNPKFPYLISGGREKVIFLWNLETKEIIKKIPVKSSITYVKFSDDGKYFLTISLKKEIKIYDLWNLKILQKYKINEGTMLTVGISEDWSILAISPFKKQPISIQIIFNKKKKKRKNSQQYLIS
ncbi:WD40 repeat domain-containing protein [Promethearchaeum syntrophicum]|uniref:WD40 repeat domain-containing protein n=1 Tax=Promethearchaeum syntrophicum TaxID=2594042 RepID=A0A5B9D6G5_9ARCH|nr:WD40 repeat domain-containing protein [Candidatus Prometheoarchaeum syntrophicum]QEE14377.1 WD domain, G-beta repeat [Candidatus Prometheoarchaeum syntrophicum]